MKRISTENLTLLFGVVLLALIAITGAVLDQYVGYKLYDPIAKEYIGQTIEIIPRGSPQMVFGFKVMNATGHGWPFAGKIDLYGILQIKSQFDRPMAIPLDNTFFVPVKPYRMFLDPQVNVHVINYQVVQ